MTIEVAETSRRYRMLYRSPWWTLVGMFTSPSWVAVGYTLQFLDEPVKLVDIARSSEYFQRYPLNRPTSTLKEWDWLWLIPSLYTLYTWCQTPPFSGSHNMWLHPLQHFFLEMSESSPSHEWNPPCLTAFPVDPKIIQWIPSSSPDRPGWPHRNGKSMETWWKFLWICSWSLHMKWCWKYEKINGNRLNRLVPFKAGSFRMYQILACWPLPSIAKNSPLGFPNTHQVQISPARFLPREEKWLCQVAMRIIATFRSGTLW